MPCPVVNFQKKKKIKFQDCCAHEYDNFGILKKKKNSLELA